VLPATWGFNAGRGGERTVSNEKTLKTGTFEAVMKNGVKGVFAFTAQTYSVKGYVSGVI